MNDKELLKQVKADPEAFGSVYDLHYVSIFNHVFKRTGDFEVSRDITAEVFLKAYLSISSFVWKGVPISAWLYRIAINETNLFFRKRKYAQRVQDTYGELLNTLADPSSLESEKVAADQILLQDQEFRAVQKALILMPLKYQEVLALRYFEQKKIKEIALIVDKKEGTIKSLLSRGLEMLRRKLMQPNTQD